MIVDPLLSPLLLELRLRLSGRQRSAPLRRPVGESLLVVSLGCVHRDALAFRQVLHEALVGVWHEEEAQRQRLHLLKLLRAGRVSRFPHCLRLRGGEGGHEDEETGGEWDGRGWGCWDGPRRPRHRRHRASRGRSSEREIRDPKERQVETKG
eukprot:356470-Pyramimonas_sp.AAC.1